MTKAVLSEHCCLEIVWRFAKKVKTSTVAGHIFEDSGQTFFDKVSGIYCSPANEDIAMNPIAISPNFIICIRKIFSDFSINHINES